MKVHHFHNTDQVHVVCNISLTPTTKWEGIIGTHFVCLPVRASVRWSVTFVSAL